VESSFSWRQAKAKYLQKLILKSKAARYLAIRQVTQLNAGKKTAGVDGKASLTFEERFDLSDELKTNVNTWNIISCVKSQSPKRTDNADLKVPTIADRAWQCLAKYALEPAHEATFPCEELWISDRTLGARRPKNPVPKPTKRQTRNR
jgi:retron-type reverse transcriptase